MGNEPETILKVPAKALACLRPGYLTVLVGHGLGMAEGGVPTDIPIDLVPFDLRTPNSEFTVVLDRDNGQYIAVERQSDDAHDQGVPAGAVEQKLSRSLRSVLEDLPVGANIPDSDKFREVLTALQYFIPIILGEIHREWTGQGLDGVVPVEVRKTAQGEVEIFGLCCFVSDQTLTPLHLHFQIAMADDQISWLECRLGERGQNGMVRKPYRFLREMTKRLHTFAGKADRIDWVYSVTYGNRRV